MLANSEDLDEMQHIAAFHDFHQGLHCLGRLKQPLRTEIHHNFSDFIWPFAHPYMGFIPDPKMAFIFPMSCILALIFPILIKYFPKCEGKGSFQKSQIKSLNLENSINDPLKYCTQCAVHYLLNQYVWKIPSEYKGLINDNCPT